MQMPFMKFIFTKLQRKYSYGPCLDRYFSGGRLRYLLDFLAFGICMEFFGICMELWRLT